MGRSPQHANSTLDDISDILSDVKMSGCIGKSGRQSKLFAYLLKRSFEKPDAARESSNLTQRRIAIDVLERPDTFDASSDSIVRVEMHRLRSNLKAYNSGAFKYHITIPAGEYRVVVKPRQQGRFLDYLKKPVPLALTALLAVAAYGAGYFMARVHDGQTASMTRIECSPLMPSLRVENIGAPSATQNYVESVIRAALGQHTRFQVLSAGQLCAAPAAPQFSIKYALVPQGEFFNIAIKAVDAQSGDIVVSDHVTGNMAEAQNGSDLYFDIVRSVNMMAIADSIVARAAWQNDWPNLQARDSFGCVIAMYDSFSNGGAQNAEARSACLERAVNNDAVAADNIGALASEYLYQARHGGGAAAFEKAKALLEDDPQGWLESTEITIAKMYYEAQREDFNAERLDMVLMNAEGRYGTNPIVLLSAAFFHGNALGQWEKAKTLSDRAQRLYTIRDQSVFGTDAQYGLIMANRLALSPQQIMAPCEKFYTPESAYIVLIVNACARKAGHADWYDLTESRLSEMGYPDAAQRLNLLKGLHHDWRLVQMMEEVLSTEFER